MQYHGFPKDNWEKKNKELKGKITDFILVHERKRFGVGRIWVHTLVMNVETRLEDSEYLKVILIEAMKTGGLPGPFIEAGLHITASPKELIEILNMQNNFFNNCKPIPVIGIMQAVMERGVTRDQRKETMMNHLIKCFNLKR